MNEYKRLTYRKIDGTIVVIAENNISYINPAIIKLADPNLQKAINRLAELEDKLEAGTLVEFPCLIESPYEEDVILLYSHTEDKKAIECETFFTREAAEARLKELEEGK